MTSNNNNPNVDVFYGHIEKREFLDAVERSESPMVVTTHDPQNPTIIYANRSHEKLSGYNLRELIGLNPRLFQGKDTNRDSVRILKYRLQHYDYWEGTMTNYTKNGDPYVVRLMIFGVELVNRERLFVAIKKKV